jgi:hypothetical protein
MHMVAGSKTAQERSFGPTITASRIGIIVAPFLPSYPIARGVVQKKRRDFSNVVIAV